jgi:hypothetical protein
MIGYIHLERGNVNEAIDAFMRGLQAPSKTRDEEVVLAFEIGAAYETKKVSREAISYYQRCARLDPTFRDVEDRIRRLQRADTKAPIRAAAVGADDEFDRAFDDLLGKA